MESTIGQILMMPASDADDEINLPREYHRGVTDKRRRGDSP